MPNTPSYLKLIKLKKIAQEDLTQEINSLIETFTANEDPKISKEIDEEICSKIFTLVDELIVKKAEDKVKRLEDENAAREEIERAEREAKEKIKENTRVKVTFFQHLFN